jgi:hypothetical protein
MKGVADSRAKQATGGEDKRAASPLAIISELNVRSNATERAERKQMKCLCVSSAHMLLCIEADIDLPMSAGRSHSWPQVSVYDDAAGSSGLDL